MSDLSGLTPDIKKYFLSLGLDNETSEDLSQDVYIKMAENYLDKKESKKNLRSLMYEVARNVRNDHFRKEYRLPKLQSIDEVEYSLTDNIEVDSEAIKNIDKIIDLFNNENISLVIHTGDIANAKSLDKFSRLKSDLIGVFGNNDREETGLQDKAKELGFQFLEPPSSIKLNGREIAIFHEPEPIEDYIKNNSSVDLILHGHTHRYREESFNETKIFNPGESAGIIEGKNAVGLVDLNSLNAMRIFF